MAESYLEKIKQDKKLIIMTAIREQRGPSRERPFGPLLQGGPKVTPLYRAALVNATAVRVPPSPA